MSAAGCELIRQSNRHLSPAKTDVFVSEEITSGAEPETFLVQARPSNIFGRDLPIWLTA